MRLPMSAVTMTAAPRNGPMKRPIRCTPPRVDSTRARLHLGWQPRLRLQDALRLTADWYRDHAAGADMRALTFDQIAGYQARMMPPG